MDQFSKEILKYFRITILLLKAVSFAGALPSVILAATTSLLGCKPQIGQENEFTRIQKP